LEEFMAQYKIKDTARQRRNGEIYSFYRDLNVVNDIKVRKLGWARHVVRMEDDRIPKYVS
jgi:uncharacterized Rossmann fold enzyme